MISGYPEPSKKKTTSRREDPALEGSWKWSRVGILWSSGRILQDQPILVDKKVWEVAKDFGWWIEVGGSTIVVRTLIEGKAVLLSTLVKELVFPEAIGRQLWKKKPSKWWDYRKSNLTLQRPGPGGGRQWPVLPKKTELWEVLKACPELGRLPTDEEHLRERMKPVPPPAMKTAEEKHLLIQQKRRK